MRLAAYDLSRCRSCFAVIVWGLTAEGRRMPVDAQPDPHGNLTLSRRDDGEIGVTVGDVAGGEGGLVRYRPHFATCPHANDWRRR